MPLQGRMTFWCCSDVLDAALGDQRGVASTGQLAGGISSLGRVRGAEGQSTAGVLVLGIMCVFFSVCLLMLLLDCRVSGRMLGYAPSVGAASTEWACWRVYGGVGA